MTPNHLLSRGQRSMAATLLARLAMAPKKCENFSPTVRQYTQKPERSSHGPRDAGMGPDLCVPSVRGKSRQKSPPESYAEAGHFRGSVCRRVIATADNFL